MAILYNKPPEAAVTVDVYHDEEDQVRQIEVLFDLAVHVQVHDDLVNL